ncbi:MAG: hypothetical protein B7X06_02535 [Verrucomicrobia bacterium 21-51-4]|nr:MAG: hypothetical protein B7X06_02535 [Verrucomicrobia bacterium 21-51-4]
MADNAHQLQPDSWDTFLAKFRTVMHTRTLPITTLNIGVRLLCHLAVRGLPCPNPISESLFTLLRHMRISDEASRDLFKACEPVFSDPHLDFVHTAAQCIQYFQTHRSTTLQTAVSKAFDLLLAHMPDDTRGIVFVQVMECGSACPEVQAIAFKHFSERLSSATAKQLPLFAKALLNATRSAKLPALLQQKIKSCAASLASVPGLDPQLAGELKHASH